DVQVALDLHGEVEQRVLAEGGEHVVVEPDAGRDVGVARPVELDLDEHLGLAGRALDPAYATHPITSSSARRNAAISSGVPIDTRSQPSGPVSRISTPRSSRPCHTACRSANVPKRTKFASESAACRPVER